MKILFVNPYESSLFSFRKELLDKLIEDGHEIVLCINDTPKIQNIYENKLNKIVDVKMSLKDKGIISNLKLKKTYKKIINNEKPDLILSFGYKPNVYCGLYSKEVPIIANITGLGNLFSKKGLLYKIGVNLYRKAFKNVDYVLFQNTDEKDFFLENKIPLNKYDVIPGSGVNTERFAPLLNYSLPNNETRFLFVSRAIKEKGYNLLLDAIPSVLNENSNVNFTLVSAEEDIFSDPNIELIQKQFPNRVKVIKRSDDLVKLYSNHHFLVAPSFYREGVSNVLLESLSCERPIITTYDNPGCKEVLVDGINGFGVKSNDLNSLINALNKASKLTTDEIIKMGQNGREFVKEHFERSIVVNKYLDIINSLS